MNKKRYIEFIIIFIFLVSGFILINKTNFNKNFYNLGMKLLDRITYRPKDISNNITLGINKDLEKENNELKNLLVLKEEIYNLTVAKIIKREDWYNELIINKGLKDNLNINDSVVSNKQLIGRIKSIGNNYSVVELITSNKDTSKISVKINDTYGIVSGYSYKENVLIVDNLLKNNNISILDKVYTSGLGELEARGIYIGYVVDIANDEKALSKIVKIKPGIDLNNINYVGVISR